MQRFIRYSHQGAPIGEVSPNDVLSLTRREEINGEHSISITTLQVLGKGERVIYQDERGKWREYEIAGVDEAHANGERIVGTYYGVWSLQPDLQGVTVSKMPGVQSPVNAGTALAAALESQTRWEVGTVTNTNTGGASMYDMSAWQAFGVLVENWGGELDVTIEVDDLGVVSRKVDYYAQQGEQDAKRRYDFGADVKSIKRTMPDDPLYCRISPRGAGEQTESGGYGRKITIESVNGGVDWLQYAPMVDVAKISDGHGGWQYPTLIVENGDCKTPSELKSWAQSELVEILTPKVTYDIDVLQAAREGVDIHAVSLGDAVHVVDAKFNDLRVSGRIVEMVTDEVSGRTMTVKIGHIDAGLAGKLSTASKTASAAYNRVVTLQNGLSTAEYVESLLGRINAQISADGGYTYIIPSQGIRTYDAEVTDPTVGAEASKVVEIKGGAIRIANSRTAQGEWDWKTVFVSGHIAADLVTTAHITTGSIGSASGGNYWDLDNNYVRLAPTTILDDRDIESVLVDVDATITDVDVQYAHNQDPQSPPQSGWSTTCPEWQEGWYIWSRTATTNANGTTYSEPAMISGRDGADGTSVTILGSYNTLADLQAAHPTGNVGDSYIVNGDLYVWDAQGSQWSNVGTIQGPAGAPGQSITITSVQWAAGTSGTTAPSSGWQSTVPTVDKGKWLWCRVTYSDGTRADTASYQGTDGADGKSVYVQSSTKVDGVTTIVLTDGTTQNTIRIEDGADGDNGTPGANGLNGYVHTAWANSADGSVDFSTSVSTGKQYLGVYTDNTQADSQRYQDYSWSLIKGAKGDTGAQGAQGAQGPQGVKGDTGDAAVVYSIAVSVDAITRTQNAITPSSVTFSAKSKTGEADAVAYSGRFIVQTSEDGATWTTRYTSSTNQSTCVYTPASDIAASAKFIRGTLYKAGGTSTQLDAQTVAIVSNGTNGTNGTNGADAYTVILSNESHTFPGNESAAIGSSTTCSVIAYKGATRVAATIGTISGKPSGMTTTITSNGTTSAYFTVTVTALMTTRNGVLTVPITVDGKSFTRQFSWALALKGSTGAQGIKGDTGIGVSQIVEQYYLSTSSTTQTGDSWKTTQPAWESGKYIWTRSQVTWSDGNVTTTDPVLAKAINGANTSAKTAVDEAAKANAMIRTYNDGVLVCRQGNTVGALVNADGSFDVVAVSWSQSGVPTAGRVYASYGDVCTMGRLTTTSCQMRMQDDGFYLKTRDPASHSYIDTLHLGFGYVQYVNTMEYGAFFDLGYRQENTIIGYESLIVGARCAATKIHSVAMGYECTAQHDTAFAFGNYVTTTRQYQLACGSYNVTGTESMFVVGRGSRSGRADGFRVYESGSAWLAGRLTQNSDRRLKEHIAYLAEDACEFVRKLKPALFVKDGERHLGFYAQDVDEADEWGTSTVEEQHTDESLDFDPLTLEYTALIAPIVAYAQSLEKRIEQLEKRLSELEERGIQ